MFAEAGVVGALSSDMQDAHGDTGVNLYSLTFGNLRAGPRAQPRIDLPPVRFGISLIYPSYGV